jgi:hypothetical protein
VDLRELDQRIAKLLVEKQFAEAEEDLRCARAQASEEGDNFALEHILSSFVELYCTMEPRETRKAESYCLELEQLSGTAYSKLRTAMTLYWCIHDPSKAVAKAQEAIAAATAENDSKTLYQGLSVSGLALLDLGRTAEAGQMLLGIEKMVIARQPVVVGDETLFLERLSQQSKDSSITTVVKAIANMLWPVCREAQFAKRLKALAGE